MGNFLIHFLGADTGNAVTDILFAPGGLKDILIYILAAAGAASVGFAVYLGYLLAKAEDASKRQKAKKRIMNVVVGLIIIVILTTLLLNPGWAGYQGDVDRDGEDNGGGNDNKIPATGYAITIEKQFLEIGEFTPIKLWYNGSEITYQSSVQFNVSKPDVAKIITVNINTVDILMVQGWGYGTTTVKANHGQNMNVITSPELTVYNPHTPNPGGDPDPGDPVGFNPDDPNVDSKIMGVRVANIAKQYTNGQVTAIVGSSGNECMAIFVSAAVSEALVGKLTLPKTLSDIKSYKWPSETSGYDNTVKVGDLIRWKPGTQEYLGICVEVFEQGSGGTNRLKVLVCESNGSSGYKVGTLTVGNIRNFRYISVYDLYHA